MLTINTFVANKLKQIRKTRLNLGPVTRDPRHVIISLISFIILVLSTVQALKAGSLDSLERPLFNYINSLPEFLLPIFFVITQLGSFSAVLLWSIFAYSIGKARALFTLLLAAFSSWVIAKTIKVTIGRERPGDILESIKSLSIETFSGYGFPSGHATMAAACITVIFFSIERKYRKYLLGVGFLVGFSRIYLGAHFPLDIVGGWALGALVGSIFCLIIGSRRAPVDYVKLKNKLEEIGISKAKLQKMNVDARGSVPIVATTQNRKEYFIKVFGSQEYAADWLFKLIRLIKFKNKANEEVYVNSKRNIELESLASLWASNVGVRTPKQVAIFKIGSRWVLVQEMIKAKPISAYKKVKTATLEDIWQQVKKLHDGNISHRDLRADNIMVDAKGKSYLIDFGFSEVAPNKIRKNIDVAQLLMSISLIAGVKRSVDTSKKVLGKQALLNALPYVQHSAFSHEISKQVKKQENILENLKAELKRATDIELDIEEAKLSRLSIKKIVLFVFIAASLYVLIPQLSEFKGTLNTLGDIHLGWAALAVVASSLTYFAAGSTIYNLIALPFSLIEIVLVQFAGSFVSKLLPGGIGSATLILRYFNKVGVTIGKSSAVIASERAIGAISLGLLTLVMVIFSGNDQGILDITVKPVYIIYLVVAIIGSIAILYYLPKLRNKIQNLLTDAKTQINELLDSPGRLLKALISTTLVTLFYILCLYFSLKSVGQTINIFHIFLVYVSASLAKGFSPTPGGLGALEVAMAVALRSFGVPAPESFATVVVYRLATYWLPLPVGLISYNYLQKQNKI